jgi:hypothetical protein
MKQSPSPTKPKKSRRSLYGASNGHDTHRSDPSVSPDPGQPADRVTENEPDNPLPTLIVLLINLVIIVLGTVLPKNSVMLPCVTLQGSALSVVCVSLMVSHIIWRFVYPIMARIEGVVELPVIKIPLSALIAILNIVHPWRLKGLHFILLVLVLAATAALNLTPYSPFRTPGEPFAIQGFSVLRSTLPSLEHLAPGATLIMNAGEKVILEVVLIGNAQVSCTWSASKDGDDARQGCSIDYTAFSPGDSDILTVFVQPVCELRREPASLFVTVQP